MASQTVHIPCGITLFASLEGEPGRPVLVFIHGHTGSHGKYVQYQQAFKDRFQVLAYDQRGHGDSDKPIGTGDAENEALYSIERLVDDLEGLLQATGLHAIDHVVIGHSLGGRVALAYALTKPSRLKGVVAISTSAGFQGGSRDAMTRVVEHYKHDVRPMTKERVLEESLKVAYSTRHFREHADVMAEEAEKRLKTSPVARVFTLLGFATQDLTPRLREITVPVLVMHGQRDGVVPWANGMRIHESIPGSRALFLPKSSHQLLDENKKEAIECIDAFLAAILPST